jgi:hypothetical protein
MGPVATCWTPWVWSFALSNLIQRNYFVGKGLHMLHTYSPPICVCSTGDLFSSTVCSRCSNWRTEGKEVRIPKRWRQLSLALAKVKQWICQFQGLTLAFLQFWDQCFEWKPEFGLFDLERTSRWKELNGVVYPWILSHLHSLKLDWYIVFLVE